MIVKRNRELCIEIKTLNNLNPIFMQEIVELRFLRTREETEFKYSKKETDRSRN